MTLDELVADPRRVGELSREQTISLVMTLAALQSVAAAQLACAPTSTNGNGHVPADTSDDLIDADRVIELLGLRDRRAVYGLARRADWKAFTIRVNRRTLRFRSAGLQRWLARRGRAA